MDVLLPKELHKTKIIATIGPSSWDKGIFWSMVESGLDIVRINASFANAKEIRRVTKMVREIGPHVAVLLDTNGHKVRLNDFGKPMRVRAGEHISIFSQPSGKGVWLVTENQIRLEEQIPVGAFLLLDDGTIKLKVSSITGSKVDCEIVQGGLLTRMKTVSIPGVAIDFGDISKKDREDIACAVDLGLDMVAISFVRSAEDVRAVRALLAGSNIAIVSKIEDQQGVENFKSILDVSDGIMIARGDLSLDVLPERVPLIQKNFVRDCNIIGKPVVVATQMLQSMVEAIVPTRAEVSDVANAILDGADAVMLSAETATGRYPAEAVSMMARIAKETELSLEPRKFPPSPLAQPTTNAIAYAVFDTCTQLPVKMILVATGSGCTAQTISRFWLKQPIYAFTRNHTAKMRLTLSRGVVPDVMGGSFRNSADGIHSMVRLAKQRGYVKDEDLVVVVAGANVIEQGGTNMLEINTVARIIS